MIGIVTPYKILNYGTKLQAYAMQQVMSKYDEAELLGFIPSTDKRPRAIIGKLYIKAAHIAKRKSNNASNDLLKERNSAINSFDRHYKFGKIVKGTLALKKELKKYDAIVCGSDQLWAPLNVWADYFTLTIVPKGIKKFSYAASFGVNDIPLVLKHRYKRFLESLNHISVREERGKELVEQIASREAQVVLDPTLMLEKEEWIELSKDSKMNVKDSYIFCYFLGTEPEHRRFAKDLAERTGLKLVTIPHFKEWNAADENFGDEPIYGAGPVEFLQMIKNATYVCTDSFHGTVFSIIFNRQVAVFERFKKGSTESTNSRIYTLLNSLDLGGQLVRDVGDIDEFVENSIDYDKVQPKLQILKEKSFRYLDEAIGMKRREVR